MTNLPELKTVIQHLADELRHSQEKLVSVEERERELSSNNWELELEIKRLTLELEKNTSSHQNHDSDGRRWELRISELEKTNLERLKTIHEKEKLIADMSRQMLKLKESKTLPTASSRLISTEDMTKLQERIDELRNDRDKTLKFQEEIRKYIRSLDKKLGDKELALEEANRSRTELKAEVHHTRLEINAHRLEAQKYQAMYADIKHQLEKQKAQPVNNISTDGVLNRLVHLTDNIEKSRTALESKVGLLENVRNDIEKPRPIMVVNVTEPPVVDEVEYKKTQQVDENPHQLTDDAPHLCMENVQLQENEPRQQTPVDMRDMWKDPAEHQVINAAPDESYQHGPPDKPPIAEAMQAQEPDGVSQPKIEELIGMFYQSQY